MSLSICVAVAGKTIALAGLSFTLSWTHSVEKVEWRERWTQTVEGLVLTEAAVKGSGAGMEPGEDAVLTDGWWVWRPRLAAQPQLVLAASGATVSPWRLCSGETCHDIGAESSMPAIVRSCGP